MANDDEIQFHSNRVTAEIDQARRAASLKAAHAHLQLSALHLERVRVLAGGPMLGTVHSH